MNFLFFVVKKSIESKDWNFDKIPKQNLTKKLEIVGFKIS